MRFLPSVVGFGVAAYLFYLSSIVSFGYGWYIFGGFIISGIAAQLGERALSDYWEIDND